jgi:hypothetical protein
MGMKAGSVVLLTLVLLAAAVARADEAGVGPLRSELAAKHVARAKELEFQGFFQEARAERLVALELDPDQKDARFALGYKREGDEWKGQPAPARKDRHEWEGKPVSLTRALHEEAAARLAVLAAVAKKEGREEDARSLAGLALDEDQECRKAREVLGHQTSGKDDHLGRTIFFSEREKAVRDAFAHAALAAKNDEPALTPGDEALEALLGLGPLDRRESEHAIYLATKAAKADLPALARYVDTIRHAWSELLAQDDAVAPSTSRVGVKVRWIVVAPSEHEAFVAKAILDPARRKLAKQLGSWSGWTLAGPRSADGGATGDQEALFVYESSLAAENRAEWMALTAVKTLIQQRLPAKAPPPGFLVEGLGRFFAGRATGRIDMSFLSSKVSLSVHERTAWSWDELHANVRDALARSLEGDLRRLVSKSLNDLEDADSELALAFVEYLLARRPKELSSFVAALSPDEPALATLERVTGSKVEGLEREMRAWAREEY